jgi:hypothetical protein
MLSDVVGLNRARSLLSSGYKRKIDPKPDAIIKIFQKKLTKRSIIKAANGDQVSIKRFVEAVNPLNTRSHIMACLIGEDLHLWYVKSPYEFMVQFTDNVNNFATSSQVPELTLKLSTTIRSLLNKGIDAYQIQKMVSEITNCLTTSDVIDS